MPTVPVEAIEAVTQRGMTSRRVTLGEMSLAEYRIPKGFDASGLYDGLPGGRCPCEHWGYVVSGKLLMRTETGEEVLEGGEFFHLLPGHLGVALEDTVMIEFTRAEDIRAKDEALGLV